MERKLKIILCIVLTILIALVSFLGIYVKKGISFENKLPEFLLSSEFTEKRLTRFVINDSKEEVIYDKDGNKVDSIPEGANEEEYRKETIYTNPEEDRTVENYRKVKEVFDNRFKDLGINYYNVRVDEVSGDLILEQDESIQTDETLQYLQGKGDFSISDSESKEILLDKTHVKGANVLYNNSQDGGIAIILDIKFDSEGKKILHQISKDYLDENAGSEEENSEENPDQKKVTMTIDGREIFTSTFVNELPDGELMITMGTATDSDTLSDLLKETNAYVMLISNDDSPLSYDIESSETVRGNLIENGVKIGIYTSIALFVILVVYMIIRYKTNGILAGINLVAVLSLLILMIRYTRIVISVNSFVAIWAIMILYTYLITKMLNKINTNSTCEEVKKASIRIYIENFEVALISVIIAIVFTFMKQEVAYSFGMTMFYGIISIVLSNFIFLRTMLVAKYNK